MVTTEIKELLKQISILCTKASEEIFEDTETLKILNLCDKLTDEIDSFLGE